MSVILIDASVLVLVKIAPVHATDRSRRLDLTQVLWSGEISTACLIAGDRHSFSIAYHLSGDGDLLEANFLYLPLFLTWDGFSIPFGQVWLFAVYKEAGSLYECLNSCVGFIPLSSLLG